MQEFDCGTKGSFDVGRMHSAYQSPFELFQPLIFAIELLCREDIGFAVVDGAEGY